MWREGKTQLLVRGSKPVLPKRRVRGCARPCMGDLGKAMLRYVRFGTVERKAGRCVW